MRDQRCFWQQPSFFHKGQFAAQLYGQYAGLAFGDGGAGLQLDRLHFGDHSKFKSLAQPIFPEGSGMYPLCLTIDPLVIETKFRLYIIFLRDVWRFRLVGTIRFHSADLL